MLESLEIGGKTYDLYLGFDFIHELDKRHQTEYRGLKFGVGVGTTMMQLIMRSPIAVLDFIQAATITERQKPSVRDIENLFAEWYENGETEQMYEAFLERLVRSPLTAPIAKDSYQIAEMEEPETETEKPTKKKTTTKK